MFEGCLEIVLFLKTVRGLVLGLYVLALVAENIGLPLLLAVQAVILHALQLIVIGKMLLNYIRPTQRHILIGLYVADGIVAVQKFQKGVLGGALLLVLDPLYQLLLVNHLLTRARLLAIGLCLSAEEERGLAERIL